jgi:DNA repair photolyase
MQRLALFPEQTMDQPPPALPALGEQADIVYYAAPARRILNPPAATGMEFWSINPYVGCAFGCAYCYARYAHRYTLQRAGSGMAEGGDGRPPANLFPDDGRESLEPEDPAAESLPPWLAFERRILVKERAPELLRRELRSGGRRTMPARGDVVVVGTATDPYQPAERRFRITRGVLETLAECRGLRVTIVTKSPLVTRDVDVLARIAARSSLSIHLSLITLDRELARRLEPRAPTPEARVRALARLREAGIDAGVNVMPVLPGITDGPQALEALVRRIAEVGATFAGACALRLQATARERYLPFIEAEFPHLAARYRAAYGGGHQMGVRYREGLARTFARLCARYGVRVWGGARDEPDAAGGGVRGAAAGVSQLTLPL